MTTLLLKEDLSFLLQESGSYIVLERSTEISGNDNITVSEQVTILICSCQDTYLLKEDGSRLLQEDGSEIILVREICISIVDYVTVSESFSSYQSIILLSTFSLITLTESINIPITTLYISNVENITTSEFLPSLTVPGSNVIVVYEFIRVRENFNKKRVTRGRDIAKNAPLGSISDPSLRGNEGSADSNGFIGAGGTVY